MLQDEATYRESDRRNESNSRFRNFWKVPNELMTEPERICEIIWKEWMKQWTKAWKKRYMKRKPNERVRNETTRKKKYREMNVTPTLFFAAPCTVNLNVFNYHRTCDWVWRQIFNILLLLLITSTRNKANTVCLH